MNAIAAPVAPDPVMTAAIDTRLLTSDAPIGEKVYINIGESRPDGKRDVCLIVPLDRNDPVQAAAWDLGDPGRLQLEHAVNLDLHGERRDFAKAMEGMYDPSSAIGKALRADLLASLDEGELRTALKPLALQGGDLFHRMFREIPCHEYPGHEQTVRQAMLSALSHTQRIVIDAPSFRFPWAFLYDDREFDSSRLGTLKMDRFWGFQHELQEDLGATARLRLLPARPEIVIAVCSSTDPSGTRHAGAFPGDKCTVSARSTVNELGSSLADFDADCLYFYGHASQMEPPTSTSSWLKLRGNELTVADLRATYLAPNFRRVPVLVFLNGCNTGPFSTWDESSIAGFLCNRTAFKCACLVTTDSVPGVFAAEMARTIWSALLEARMPVGAALRHARIAMLRRWNNPLGLVYSFFGPIDMRLRPEGSC